MLIEEINHLPTFKKTQVDKQRGEEIQVAYFFKTCLWPQITLGVD